MMNIQLQQFLDDIGIEGHHIKISKAIWAFYDEFLKERKPVKVESDFNNIFIENEYIKEIVNVLKRKKAIILRGVPGVGKTFVINDIISNSFDNIGENGMQMIQFHQSYAYEEFVEGLRPQMNGGYDIEKGIFYEICDTAKDNPDLNYFLIIDEINRGNMSKIFGELLMLIENDKRDDYSVTLPYSKEEFIVPGNLYIIGTMNTADRSLSLVDYAMRRRFSFMTLEPAFDTEKFNAYLKNNMGLKSGEISLINRTMVEVNNLIVDRLGKDFQIGHSYFIADKETITNFTTWFHEIVKYEIMPMIEEYFFDDSSTVEEIATLFGEAYA